MTADEYFNDHLPHRVNLLTTFRDRYSPNAVAKPNRPKQNHDQPRDFFRCSKDVSMMMVRFFCDELGLRLGMNDSDITEHNRPLNFGNQRFPLSQAKADCDKYKKLLIVMKAANRAVAHINPSDVDHPIRLPSDHEILWETIDWIEQLIETQMYIPNGRSLAAAMKLPNNAM